jgi:hypothetical protein
MQRMTGSIANDTPGLIRYAGRDPCIKPRGHAAAKQSATSGD